MKRIALLTITALVVLGFAVPHVDIDFMRPRIERAIERGLGRKVEVGQVYMNLFTGPGFTVEDVTVHDDPRAGIEPFIYVRSLEARVRLLSLFSRKLEFSSLRLADDANINLVKTDAGPWNFQWLLGAAQQTGMTAINMRAGRVNFKFGDTKSVFYFNDADLDVSPAGDGSVNLRFSGSPSRTDQPQQNFGHFFVRGKWTGQGFDMRLELEPSAIAEVARLFDQQGFGLHGIVAFDAQMTGPPSKLDLSGTIRVDDVHRWDLLPKRGGGWSVSYKGTLDLRGENLELASVAEQPDAPLRLSFHVRDFLTQPHWEAGADLNKVPVSALVEVARHMGAAVSDKLTAEGSVSGTALYREDAGFDGQLKFDDASLTLPDAQPLRASEASVAIGGKRFSLDTATVKVGENEAADVDGSFEIGAGLDVRIVTKSLNVADLRSFGLASIPVVEQTPQGTWRGWARYRWNPGEKGEWTGEYELQNARLTLDGVAAPVRLQSAAVNSSPGRVALTRIRARLGEIALTGEYRWEAAAARPHHFKIAIPKANASEIESIFAPALLRERGFLARTLRLGPAPVPDWLANRHVDGTISIDALNFGDVQARLDSARLLWDGPSIRLAHLTAHADQTSANGDLEIGLANRVPHYRFDGKIAEIPYKGGRVDLEGTFESDGSGAELIGEARGQGSLHARSIAFAPEADFRTVSGCFEILPELRWKLSCLEIVQGSDVYSGSGSSGADGRLVLDLSTARGRQVRYSSGLAGGPSQQ